MHEIELEIFRKYFFVAFLQLLIQFRCENILLNQIPCLLSVCICFFLLLISLWSTCDYELLPEFFLVFELFVDKRDLFVKKFDIHEVFFCNDATGCFLLLFLCVLSSFNAIRFRLLLIFKVGRPNVEQKFPYYFVLRPLILLLHDHIGQGMESEEMIVHDAVILYILSELIEYF